MVSFLFRILDDLMCCLSIIEMKVSILYIHSYSILRWTCQHAKYRSRKPTKGRHSAIYVVLLKLEEHIPIYSVFPMSYATFKHCERHGVCIRHVQLIALLQSVHGHTVLQLSSIQLNYSGEYWSMQVNRKLYVGGCGCRWVGVGACVHVCGRLGIHELGRNRVTAYQTCNYYKRMPVYIIM